MVQPLVAQCFLWLRKNCDIGRFSVPVDGGGRNRDALDPGYPEGSVPKSFAPSPQEPGLAAFQFWRAPPPASHREPALARQARPLTYASRPPQPHPRFLRVSGGMTGDCARSGRNGRACQPARMSGRRRSRARGRHRRWWRRRTGIEPASDAARRSLVLKTDHPAERRRRQQSRRAAIIAVLISSDTRLVGISGFTAKPCKTTSVQAEFQCSVIQDRRTRAGLFQYPVTPMT